MMRTAIIIPARYESKRFPGKPLVSILGYPLIAWTYRAAEIAIQPFNDVSLFVATDDQRIQKVVENFGGQVIMTSSNCNNGTERICEALHTLNGTFDCIINFQGDSPMITPAMVKACRDAIDEGESVATPMMKFFPSMTMHFQSDLKNQARGGTSVVFDHTNHALYFSKSLIPHGNEENCFFHIGLYAYTPKALQHYERWKIGDLEHYEGLEQLRFLENNWKIKMVLLPLSSPLWEVNNPNDVPIVQDHLQGLKQIFFPKK